MKASILDLRRRMKDVLRALDHNEAVTVLHRGKLRGILYPARRKPRVGPAAKHPAFGIWKDREDLKDVDSAVRELRKGRGHAV